MNLVDIVVNKELIDKVKNLGFKEVLTIENNKIVIPDDANKFGIDICDNGDFLTCINKRNFIAITDLDKFNFRLTKGMCSKMKENNIFVIFKFKNILTSEDIFSTYKNFLVNAKLCNDFSVPSIFASFADSEDFIISPFQLVSFARQFGYNYTNMLKSSDKLLSMV